MNLPAVSADHQTVAGSLPVAGCFVAAPGNSCRQRATFFRAIGRWPGRHPAASSLEATPMGNGASAITLNEAP